MSRTCFSSFKNTVAAVVGTAVEFYDFIIFGMLAPILAPIFFPDESPLTSLIQVYGTLAIGALCRPLGGYVFGRLGDRYGTAFALRWSLILMGTSTAAMGAMPSYGEIGFLAPLLIIVLRLAQGLSAGGEYSGAALFLITTRGPLYRYRSGAILSITTVGAAAFSSLTAQMFLEGRPEAWRFAFLVGGVVSLIGLWLRRQGLESSSRDPGRLKQLPWARVLLFLFIVGVGVLIYYLFLIYSVSYLIHHRQWSATEGYHFSMVLSGAIMGTSYAIAWVADKTGRGWLILKLGIWGLIILAVPLFWVYSKSSKPFIYLSILLLAPVFSAMGALLNTLSSTLFPVGMRYRGMALTYSLGAALVGSTAPGICTTLVAFTGNALMPGFYLMVVSFIALLCLHILERKIK